MKINQKKVKKNQKKLKVKKVKSIKKFSVSKRRLDSDRLLLVKQNKTKKLKEN
jgi:hypothetical protein